MSSRFYVSAPNTGPHCRDRLTLSWSPKVKSEHRLARSQYPEGPATGHLDTGFSWFPCVYKRMLRWFPSFPVATTCFSCSSPDLNFPVTYLLTPWSRVLLEKLSIPQLINKFPAFYGTRRFITAFTSARHLSLSRARLINSMPPPNSTSWRSVLILPSHLRLGLPSHYINCQKKYTLYSVNSYAIKTRMFITELKCSTARSWSEHFRSRQRW
jgi:hypothetical protein